jgi:cell division inhibitor SepF
MGALRKAGVWLGFVEDDDERAYDDREYRDSAYRGSYDDEFAEDDDDAEDVPVRPRAADRLVESRTVRPLSRPSPVTSSSTSTYGTRDNLALAPQVHARERAAAANEEQERRYQITTLHPTTYNEARTIGEHFRDGVPVIINLTELEEADAKRLVDFAAGLAFGLRGTMERVTNRVFLLSPANVQVTAEDKARIAEGGFFNQS